MVQPALNARAFTVCVSGTAIAVEYAAELAVGSVPSVVYRSVAPLVVEGQRSIAGETVLADLASEEPARKGVER